MPEEKKTVELKDEELEKVTGGAKETIEPNPDSDPEITVFLPGMPGSRKPRLTGPGKQVA